MTEPEAKRLLHPETTGEALDELQSYNGLTGKPAAIAAISDACQLACWALDRETPQKVNGFNACPACGNECKTLLANYCPDCGKRLLWCE